MRRLTSRDGDGNRLIPKEELELTDRGGRGPAAEKLGMFEDLCDEVERQQEELARELETLRGEGRAKTHKFNELLGKKLTNSYLLNLLKLHGIR